MPHPLISYIAPGAPATREPAPKALPFLRPEIGFTPKWYRDALGTDFGERWHTDLPYRAHALQEMHAELDRRFPGAAIGHSEFRPETTDLLTGLHGACVIARIYGVPSIYRADQWPTAAGVALSEAQVAELEPPDLDSNPFFQGLMKQVEDIAKRTGVVAGYINWQGVLNNAHRLRGEELFIDLLTNPDSCHHLFDCVCTTMIDAAQRLHQRQRESGFEVGFFTVSNCLVNMVSPDLYETFLLPQDRRLAEAFGCLGVHNCAWTVDPYLDLYGQLPHLAYIDMGIESDFHKAREHVLTARRAVMYRPTDLAEKSEAELEADLRRIAEELGPADIVFADIESGTPDRRVLWIIDCCRRLSERFA